MKFSKFYLSYMYAFDFGYLVSEKSQDKFLSLRSKNRFFLNLWRSFAQNEVEIGPFKSISKTPGDDLLERMKSVVDKGGKNIFAPVFYNQYTPQLYELEGKIHDYDFKKGLKIKGSTFSFDGEYASKNLLQYRNISLHLFRNGVMSICFDFCELESNPITYSAELFIELTQRLQQYLDDFFGKLILLISESIKSEPLVRKSFPHIDLATIDTNSNKASIPHGRPFRFLVLNPFEGNTKKAETPIKNCSLKDETKKELLGILNSSRWFSEYNTTFCDKIIQHSTFYKDDELFICDNNATLIVLPSCWIITELEIYIDNIRLFCELQNALLIFTHALNSIIERYLSKNNSTDFNRDITSAIEIKSLILDLEKNGDLNAFISHGFSLKFLERLSAEMKLPARSDTIYRKMHLLDEQITLDAQRKISRNQQVINIAMLVITGLALLVALESSSFSIIDFLTKLLTLATASSPLP